MIRRIYLALYKTSPVVWSGTLVLVSPSCEKLNSESQLNVGESCPYLVLRFIGSSCLVACAAG